MYLSLFNYFNQTSQGPITCSQNSQIQNSKVKQYERAKTRLKVVKINKMDRFKVTCTVNQKVETEKRNL